MAPETSPSSRKKTFVSENGEARIANRTGGDAAVSSDNGRTTANRTNNNATVSGNGEGRLRLGQKVVLGRSHYQGENFSYALFLCTLIYFNVSQIRIIVDMEMPICQSSFY